MQPNDMAASSRQEPRAIRNCLLSRERQRAETQGDMTTQPLWLGEGRAEGLPLGGLELGPLPWMKHTKY